MIDKEILKKISHKKVLITGAGGLIGSTFVDLLAKLNQDEKSNIDIYALGRNAKKLEEKFSKYLDNIHIIEDDVCSADLASLDIDFIVHAASPAHPLAYSKTPVEVMKANLIGTINMLELAKAKNASMIFISSGEIYGVSDKQNVFFKENEYGYTDILNPRACYPESKRAAETLCASYYAEYNVDTKIARLCHVYGPNITDDNSRADAQFLRNVLNIEDIVLKSPGTQVRSFCYVKDAVVALLYILLKGNPGEAYNVANKNSIATVREYAETLASLGGVKIKKEFPKEEEQKGYSQISRAVLDSSKLESLGFIPEYNLEEGLKDLLFERKKQM